MGRGQGGYWGKGRERSEGRGKREGEEEAEKVKEEKEGGSRGGRRKLPPWAFHPEWGVLTVGREAGGCPRCLVSFSTYKSMRIRQLLGTQMVLGLASPRTLELSTTAVPWFSNVSFDEHFALPRP